MLVWQPRKHVHDSPAAAAAAAAAAVGTRKETRKKPGGSHEEYMQEGHTGKALSKRSNKEACNMKAQWHVVGACSSTAGSWEMLLSMVAASLLE
jgi:hypothetical protein